MSYILDALKKAESERKPGAARASAAQQLTINLPAATARPSAPTATWLWVAVSSAAIAAGALAWFKPWQSAPAPAPAAPLVVASAPQPVRPPPVIENTAPPAPPQAPAAPPAEKVQPPEPVKPKPRASSEPAQRTAAKAVPPKASEKNVTVKPAPATAPVAESQITPLRELPPHIQSQIPTLTVNGFIYSDNKADRTVLINKRLLREGDQVAPDLTLESLTPNGMVLNFKGYRYRTSY